MNKVYEKAIELKKYYNNMKKKYPSINIWDELLKMVENKKKEILNDLESND